MTYADVIRANLAYLRSETERRETEIARAIALLCMPSAS